MHAILTVGYKISVTDTQVILLPSTYLLVNKHASFRNPIGKTVIGMAKGTVGQRKLRRSAHVSRGILRVAVRAHAPPGLDSRGPTTTPMLTQTKQSIGNICQTHVYVNFGLWARLLPGE